jgi:hypothetical protein
MSTQVSAGFWEVDLGQPLCQSSVPVNPHGHATQPHDSDNGSLKTDHGQFIHFRFQLLRFLLFLTHLQPRIPGLKLPWVSGGDTRYAAAVLQDPGLLAPAEPAGNRIFQAAAGRNYVGMLPVIITDQGILIIHHKRHPELFSRSGPNT